MTEARTIERPHVLLVTGGSRGIGAATARLAGRRGYAVCVNYHTHPAEAEAVVRDIEQAGGRAIAVKADVAVEDEVVAMFSEVDASLGHLTALVNNAAILQRQARVGAMSAARILRVLSVNVLGAFLCAREAIRRMSTIGDGFGGAIVNVSSVASRLGSPNEYVDYAATKGALDTFTVGLAREVAAEGIRVNGVRPGFIYTDIHASGGEPGRVDRVAQTIPMERGGQVDEVARAILWLLSDEASFTTGAILDVAGGK
jgi:NAD(P)-dependent dehydrogenase (short-subunit alcohol dehydrogenase family)